MKCRLTLLVLLLGCLAALPAAAQTLGRFNVFENSAPVNAIDGIIKTKVSGSTFSASTGDLRLVYLNKAKNQIFRNNSTVQVSLLDASDNSAALDSEGCRSSWTSIVSLGNVPLSQGVAILNPTIARAYRNVRFRVDLPIASAYGCSTDNFAIRPASLDVIGKDANWTSAGTGRTLDNAAASGGVVHGAGSLFTLLATAQTPSGTTVDNYDGIPVLAGLQLVLPDPLTCTACVPGTLTLGSFTASNGTLTSSTASFSEAGSIQFSLTDSTYANADLSDSSDVERRIPSNTVVLGRFVPTAYRLQSWNAPELRCAGSGACVPRSFTYLGQPFGYAIAPVIHVMALNAAGNTLANYWPSGGRASLKSPLVAAGSDCAVGALTCRIVRRDASATTQLTSTYTVASSGATPGWDGTTSTRLVVGTAAMVAFSYTTGELTLPNTDRVTLHRPAAPVPPLVANISLTLLLDDYTDSTSGGGPTGNPDMISGSLAITPLPFDFGGGVFRYGRLRLWNAYGPGQFDLAVPMQTETWESPQTGWRIASSDHCTGSGSDPAGAVSIQLSPAPGWTGGTPCTRDIGSPGLSGAGCSTLSIPERRFTKPPNAGNFNLWLAAPGREVTGRLLVTAQVPDWLTWNWTGSIGNPAGAAIFGIDRQRPILYMKELYSFRSSGNCSWPLGSLPDIGIH